MSADFLATIIDHKRQQLNRARANVPENSLRQQAEAMEPCRGFTRALASCGPDRIGIIAEIKRASPSKGPICPNLDPADLVGHYEKGGAAAVSVLTEERFFMGSPSDLTAARRATALPVLRKDFIISVYQLYETRAMGADAALLIARILSPAQLRDYVALCHELQLDALVEVHAETELDAAVDAGAKLIGINNRDLKTFSTDLRIAARLASRMTPDQIAVSASGVTSRTDIENLTRAGIFNFLIGESLVRAPDPAAFIAELMGKPA